MESFFWDYRLNAEFPFSVLEYTVTDSLADGAPRLHWHNYCELGVCTKGEGAFYFEGRRYDYHSGDIFLANDLERHGAACVPGTDTRFRFFLFLPSLLLDDAGERSAEYLLPFRCDPAHRCTHIPVGTAAGKDGVVPQLLQHRAERSARCWRSCGTTPSLPAAASNA